MNQILPTPQVPLVLVDLSPVPSPVPARKLRALLALLAKGGVATEHYRGQRYYLILLDEHGRREWVTPAWLYAWEQARQWELVRRLFWLGQTSEYEISAAGRMALSELEPKACS